MPRAPKIDPPSRGEKQGSFNGLEILLDCRWLETGGAGRVTSLLLRGLQRLSPAGSWTLWGSSSVGDYLWPGARLHLASSSPARWVGQRALLSTPPHDLACYLHFIRPLRPEPSLTLLHDTIPLRYERNPSLRWVKRKYLRLVAAHSTRLMTASHHSRRRIEEDLLVEREKVGLVTYPVDEEMVRRVQELRCTVTPRRTILYVGRFAAHKNLERLLIAFGQTEFYKSGGELHLVGGSGKEINRLRAFAGALGLSNIRIEGLIPQGVLDRLYASSRALIMPSLEEGFGLPAWEAICCGLPVYVSDGGSLPELVSGRTRPFSACSTEAMAAAIDREHTISLLPKPPRFPSYTDFAQQILDELSATVEARASSPLRRLPRSGSIGSEEAG
jgi:glycosyltransferase involved in cell wall biosynthesis